MDLERELSLLEIDWPETPAFRLELARRRRRWPLALAVAAAALAAAFAVPQSRGAILRFLDFGGVTIERVDTLPAAEERPLGADLGAIVTRAHATAALLGTPPLLPNAPVTLHLSGSVVSVLFRYAGSPVLLSEFHSGDVPVFKKVAGAATSVVPVAVGGRPGLWLSGAPHVYLFPSAPPRLAGNVLLWGRNGLTLRLEGHDLTRAEALTLSLRIR